MDELLRRNLFARVNAYLSGRVSLGQLEEWVLQVDPLLVQDPASEIAKLSGLLDLGIVDINRGHISESEFKDEIQRVLASLGTIVLSEGAQLVTGSSNTLTEQTSKGGLAVLVTS